MKRVFFLSICLIVVGILSAGCVRLRTGPFCSTPEQLDRRMIVGEWLVQYSGQWVSDPMVGSVILRDDIPVLVAPGATPLALPECKNWDPSSIWERCTKLRGQKYQLQGQEAIQIFEDGSYRQKFAAQDYSYTSPLNRWELDMTAPDSPRLKMEGMKYFAAGVGQANSSNTVSLSAQMIDRMRIQEFDKLQGNANYSPKGVSYPDAGFVYLYPRNCDGRLALVQMVFGPQDPDDTTIKNPVFTRIQADSR